MNLRKLKAVLDTLGKELATLFITTFYAFIFKSCGIFIFWHSGIETILTLLILFLSIRDEWQTQEGLSSISKADECAIEIILNLCITAGFQDWKGYQNDTGLPMKSQSSSEYRKKYLQYQKQEGGSGSVLKIILTFPFQVVGIYLSCLYLMACYRTMIKIVTGFYIFCKSLPKKGQIEEEEENRPGSSAGQGHTVASTIIS